MATKTATKTLEERRAARQKKAAARVELTEAQAELYADVIEGLSEAQGLLDDLAALASEGLGLTSQFADGVVKSAAHIKRLSPAKS